MYLQIYLQNIFCSEENIHLANVGIFIIQNDGVN